MSSSTAPSSEIHTCPTDVPSIPPWFAEVALVARYFTQQGYRDATTQQVRLARGRAGTFAVVDVAAILLGYAISGEATLEAFFTQIAPFAQPFMGVVAGRLENVHKTESGGADRAKPSHHILDLARLAF